MDHHVPSAVTRGLRRRGVDVLTAHEDGAADLDDEGLLARATELKRVVFTHDNDFLSIADRWQQGGRLFCGVIYTHQQNVTVGQAIEQLQLIAEASEPGDIENQVQFIPL
ncbi:MAG: DUF5615 family PIN-like protein [Planctomycetota bacterium]